MTTSQKHKKESVEIRNYKPEDAEKLAGIFYNTVNKINSKDYTKKQIEAWAPISTLDSGTWQKKWSKLPPLVATIENEVAGFAEIKDNGHIDCFYVHHKFQSHGIGSKLMLAIESFCNKKRLDKIYAEVSITAKPFFEKKGFKTIKQQNVVLHGVELTNFIMEKNLKNI